MEQFTVMRITVLWATSLQASGSWGLDREEYENRKKQMEIPEVPEKREVEDAEGEGNG